MGARDGARKPPADPLEVLHVLWRGAGGGAERHVLDLAGELVRRGIRTGVLYLSGDDSTGATLERLGVACHRCGIRHGGDPRGPIRVASAIRALRPRLVHDHVSTPWLRAVLPPSGERVVVATEHGHMLRPVYAREGPRLWIERLGARRTDLYIAPSDAIAAAVHVHYRFPEGRIRVVPHGIRSSVSGLPPETRREVRCELDLEPDDIAILFVGRLDETKGILDLWEAFVGAVAGSPAAEARATAGTTRGPRSGDRNTSANHGLPSSRRLKLIVAGEGELSRDIAARVSSSGLREHVRLLGYRTDVGRLMTATDIFVLPAQHEGFGIVLLEAMSAGVPVVATRTGGIPEIVTDGATGILVEPRAPDELARRFLELADDDAKRQSLGRAGCEKWARSFTLEQAVDGTLEAYRWVRDHRR